MAGYGAAGFGGGFGKGLAAVLLQNRADVRAETARQEERKDREFQLLFPVKYKDAQESGDWPGLEEFVGQYHPELVKKFKKEGSPFEALGPILQSRPTTFDEQNVIPGMPDQVQEPVQTFLGTRMQSRAGRRAEREQDLLSEESAKSEAKVALARRLSQQAGISFEEALDRVGLRDQVGSALQFQSIAGELPGNKPAYGILDRRSGQYLDPVTHEPLQGFTPRTTTASTSLGADREALSRSMFNKPFAQLEQSQQQAVMDAELKRAGEKAGTTTTARAEASAQAPLSTQQRFQAVVDLQNAWRKAEAPKREMERNLKVMEAGLNRYDKDRVGGVEAIRVTFERILDPNSVVREGEYARQGYGLSLLQRLEGYAQKYLQGGGDIPKPVLEEMVETARQFVKGMQDWNDLERERITGTANEFKVNPNLVFGTSGSAPESGGAKKTAPAPTGPQGFTIGPDGALYVNGKKVGG